jgi:hypothetical protein
MKRRHQWYLQTRNRTDREKIYIAGENLTGKMLSRDSGTAIPAPRKIEEPRGKPGGFFDHIGIYIFAR